MTILKAACKLFFWGGGRGVYRLSREGFVFLFCLYIKLLILYVYYINSSTISKYLDMKKIHSLAILFLVFLLASCAEKDLAPYDRYKHLSLSADTLHRQMGDISMLINASLNQVSVDKITVTTTNSKNSKCDISFSDGTLLSYASIYVIPIVEPHKGFWMVNNVLTKAPVNGIPEVTISDNTLLIDGQAVFKANTTQMAASITQDGFWAVCGALTGVKAFNSGGKCVAPSKVNVDRGNLYFDNVATPARAYSGEQEISELKSNLPAITALLVCDGMVNFITPKGAPSYTSLTYQGDFKFAVVQPSVSVAFGTSASLLYTSLGTTGSVRIIVKEAPIGWDVKQVGGSISVTSLDLEETCASGVVRLVMVDGSSRGVDCVVNVNADKVKSRGFVYNVVPVSVGGVKFNILDRNLGATSVDFQNSWDATLGNMYQWGRAEGFSASKPAVTVVAPILSSLEADNAGKFFIDPDMYHDWLVYEDTTRWNRGTPSAPIRGYKDPCPTGYRVPTIAEWEFFFPHQLVNSGNSRPWTDLGSYNQATLNGIIYRAHKLSGRTYMSVCFTDGSTVYLPAAGIIDDGGNFSGSGSQGSYWSSSSVKSVPQGVRFTQSSAETTSFFKCNGNSLRCVSV